MTGRSGMERIRRLLDLPGAVAGASLDAMRLGWRARNGRMPDVLTVYAQMQPDKIAVIDDRPDGTVTSLTYDELEQRTNRVANVLLDLGARPGETMVIWCGQNSIGIVTMVGAARKIGLTAVPLNYRLSDEEAAYVTDHCDATIVYVDAE
ncbi:MAG: putative fatty-acid--CoA ligase, partial [Acidimicrobiales bacterium]|nr:putative fatty-acid--CoA ligase [Acidimicrobiales bacterium]